MVLPSILAATTMLSAVPADAAAAAWPRTCAERTEGRETSSYADVVAFLDALGTKWSILRTETIGRSVRGHAIPLAVVADPPATTSAEARTSGRLVVYLQGNIHGGEVEGKEAVLMLLRELAQGKHPQWLERLVILAAPIYNIDGNEAWGEGLRNRPHQNGPPKIGERGNGGGLDLNRDCVAAQSPEMRGALEHVYRRWDPHVVMDLHTTNGTRHGYALTYAPPLHPDTDAGILAFCRERLLPEVRTRMRTRHGLATFLYGNAGSRGGRRVWSTFGADPRVVTNYAGLRSRIGILSEATSYLPFPERIEATRLFVTEVLDVVAERWQEIGRLTRAADARTTARGRTGTPEAGIRFEPVARGEEAVLLETPAATKARKPHESPGEIESVLMPVYDRSRAVASVRLPRAYAVPASEARVIEVLARHGVRALPLPSPTTLLADVYQVEAVRAGAAGLRGRYEPQEMTLSAGSMIVPTAQPLGTLAFHLLDPEAPGGVTVWGLLEAGLAVGGTHPVARLRELPESGGESNPPNEERP